MKIMVGGSIKNKNQILLFMKIVPKLWLEFSDFILIWFFFCFGKKTNARVYLTIYEIYRGSIENKKKNCKLWKSYLIYD